MSDEATEVSAHNAVPSGALALVEGLLNVLGDILYAVNYHSHGFSYADACPSVASGSEMGQRQVRE